MAGGAFPCSGGPKCPYDKGGEEGSPCGSGVAGGRYPCGGGRKGTVTDQ